MNILTIGTTDILGGAAKVSWEIRSYLKETGHTVNMFVADKRSKETDVYPIPRQPQDKIISLLTASEKYLKTDWLLETTEYKEADIVHCHNLHGRYFNLETLRQMSAEKPVVWTLHDEWAITPHCAYTLEGQEMKNGLFVCPSLSTQPRLLWDNTKRLTAAKNDLYCNTNFTVVCPSMWLLKRAEKTALSQHPLLHIPNGIDTDKFTNTDQSEARQKLNLPLDKKIILFVATAGKANTWKGWKYVEEIIENFQNNHDVLFLNVGNLQPENSTRQNVEYRAHVNNPEELALYYSAADLFLMTSIADNFPLVILEAQSCGLPVVSFKVGGVPEVVEQQKTGYIANYKDVDDLQNGIHWALSLSRDERQSLSVAASAKIKQDYTTKKMCQSYLALYQKLCKS